MKNPDFGSTIITPFLLQTDPGPPTLSALLSYARSEYLNTQKIDGLFMTKLTEFFTRVARSIFESSFSWSEYNLGQWQQFCDTRSNSSNGGICTFLMGPTADYGGEHSRNSLGVGVGVPTGTRPYKVWSFNPVHGDHFNKSLPSLLRELALQPG